MSEITFHKNRLRPFTNLNIYIYIYICSFTIIIFKLSFTVQWGSNMNGRLRISVPDSSFPVAVLCSSQGKIQPLLLSVPGHLQETQLTSAKVCNK